VHRTNSPPSSRGAAWLPRPEGCPRPGGPRLARRAWGSTVGSRAPRPSSPLPARADPRLRAARRASSALLPLRRALRRRQGGHRRRLACMSEDGSHDGWVRQLREDAALAAAAVLPSPRAECAHAGRPPHAGHGPSARQAPAHGARLADERSELTSPVPGRARLPLSCCLRPVHRAPPRAGTLWGRTDNAHRGSLVPGGVRRGWTRAHHAPRSTRSAPRRTRPAAPRWCG
jgi:hypothetical protein